MTILPASQQQQQPDHVHSVEARKQLDEDGEVVAITYRYWTGTDLPVKLVTSALLSANRDCHLSLMTLYLQVTARTDNIKNMFKYSKL